MFSKNAAFNRETVFTRSPDFVHRKNPDQSVILMRTSGDDEFFKITGVAARIWIQLDGQTSIGHILDHLQQEFEVTPEKLYQDAEAFLLKLCHLKMIS